jgi:hypothetical protein
MPTTRAPTRLPTASPSVQISPILSFSANLTMVGVTSDTLSLNDQALLINVTASSMGVSSDTVFYVTSLATALNRRLRSGGMSLFSTSWDVLAITRMDVPLDTSSDDSTNATAYYVTLTTRLADSVNSGAFADQMVNTANTFDATSLNNIVVDEVRFSPLVVEEPNVVTDDNDDGQDDGNNDDNSNKNKLTGGEIAGIVIGVLVFVAIVVGGVYYFMFVRDGASKEAFQSNADVEISL